MQSQPGTRNNGQGAEVLARQGLRLPPIVLKRLRDAGIYCQPTVSIERQNRTKEYVLRGVESGGAIGGLGAYSSFAGERGERLSWLQRVDSISVNGVHAIVVAPTLIRLEMLRIERTYDLLITRHSLANQAGHARPRLDSSILFYGRRGSLEMELWGQDAVFRGTVSPVFYNRAGEGIAVPTAFHDAIARITAAVCCVACRHSHVLRPQRAAVSVGDESEEEDGCVAASRRERGGIGIA